MFHASGDRRFTDIPGVSYLQSERADEDQKAALQRREALLTAGASYPTIPRGTLPWLMALDPFTMGPSLTVRVDDLGAAVFAYIDAVQDLYAQHHPVVRDHLDPGTVPDLRGLELDRRIQTFRLDLVVERGNPVIAEIQEAYGNAGHVHAMQQAYGLSNDGLVRYIASLGLSHALADDQIRAYDPDLTLLRQRFAAYAQDVVVQFFSEARLSEVRAAWRQCATPDLGQYDIHRRAAITRAGIAFTNPLFHGYGTKALTALAFRSDLTATLEGMIGAGTLATLRAGLPESRLLSAVDDLSALVERRKVLVIKVIDSPADRMATWGSRGIYFGVISRRQWESVLAGVRGGHLPQRPSFPARYLLSRLIESDRFDVPFLHPNGEHLATMPRARINLAPIFVRRSGHRPELVAGSAAFVNTNRKVHPGQHAVCAPLDWWHGSGCGCVQ